MVWCGSLSKRRPCGSLEVEDVGSLIPLQEMMGSVILEFIVISRPASQCGNPVGRGGVSRRGPGLMSSGLDQPTLALSSESVKGTTMPSCEVKGLKWQDVDFIETTIRIRATKP